MCELEAMEAKDVAMDLAQVTKTARHVHQHKTGPPGLINHHWDFPNFPEHSQSSRTKYTNQATAHCSTGPHRGSQTQLLKMLKQTEVKATHLGAS